MARCDLRVGLLLPAAPGKTTARAVAGGRPPATVESSVKVLVALFPGKNPFVASARHGERANEWLSPPGFLPLWVKPLTYPVFLIATEEWLGVLLLPPFRGVGEDRY